MLKAKLLNPDSHDHISLPPKLDFTVATYPGMSGYMRLDFTGVSWRLCVHKSDKHVTLCGFLVIAAVNVHIYG